MFRSFYFAAFLSFSNITILPKGRGDQNQNFEGRILNKTIPRSFYIKTNNKEIKKRKKEEVSWVTTEWSVQGTFKCHSWPQLLTFSLERYERVSRAWRNSPFLIFNAKSTAKGVSVRHWNLTSRQQHWVPSGRKSPYSYLSEIRLPILKTIKFTPLIGWLFLWLLTQLMYVFCEMKVYNLMKQTFQQSWLCSAL